MRAARAAAQDALHRKRQQKTARVGAIALYTWGALAFVSIVAAATIGFFPASEPQGGSQAASSNVDVQQAAEGNTNRADEETVAAAREQFERFLRSDPDIDELSTGGVTPQNTRPVENARAGSDGAGLGVDLGEVSDLPTLKLRFEAMKRRSSALFEDKVPLILRDETSALKTARLVVGPFSNQAELAEFCRAIRLQLTIDCKQTAYEGASLR